MRYKMPEGVNYNTNKNEKAQIIKELELAKEDLNFILIPMNYVAQSGRNMIYFVSANEFKGEYRELF